jgi:hypothetical protein
MESINDIKKRVQTALEEKESRVSRLREILNSPDPPSEDDINRGLRHSICRYSIMKRKRTREERALYKLMGDSSEALRKRDHISWFRTRKQVRDKMKTVSTLKIEEIGAQSSVDKYASEKRFGPVTTFLKGMAPLQLKEAEEEIAEAKKTLEDIDHIMASDGGETTRLSQCEVDLTCASEEEDSE